MAWIRATTPESIEERRNSIIDAARKLFRKLGYEDISLNGIAAEAGTAKSNVYRYFATREEIFLAIYMSLLREWSDEIEGFYRAARKDMPLEEFAGGFAKITGRHGDMLSLSAFLFVSIEKNSSPEQLREFKKLSLEICVKHHAGLRTLHPGLSLEDVVFLLKMVYAAMATFGANPKPNRHLKKILEEEEFKPIAHDFVKELAKAVNICLRGILLEKWMAPK